MRAGFVPAMISGNAGGLGRRRPCVVGRLAGWGRTFLVQLIPRPVADGARGQNVDVGEDNDVVVPAPYAVAPGSESECAASRGRAAPDRRLYPKLALPKARPSRGG